MGIVMYDQMVQGAVHKRQGIAREDFAASWSLADDKGFAFAVADGHGDPACVRSAKGSEYAVRAVRWCLDRLPLALGLNEEPEEFPTSQLAELRELREQASVLRQLALGITRNWRIAVTNHFAQHPLSDEESASCGERGQVFAQECVEKLYGTTLVAGVLLCHVCVLLQQGDGSCVVLYEDGTCAHPIADDERCQGTLTTSLSDADAAGSMRFAVLDLSERQLAACLLASDGVTNALPSVGGTDDLLRGLVQRALALGKNDIGRFKEELANELDTLSAEGSGDDASVAGFINLVEARAVLPAIEEERQRFSRELEMRMLSARLQSMQRKHDHIVALCDAGTKLTDEQRAYLQEHDRIVAQLEELRNDWSPAAESLGAAKEMLAKSLCEIEAMQADESDVGEDEQRQSSSITVDSYESGREASDEDDGVTLTEGDESAEGMTERFIEVEEGEL